MAAQTQEANIKYSGLKDLESLLARNARLHRNRANKQAREEDHQRQAALRNAQLATSASQFSSIYQLPTLQIPRFTGKRRAWPEFFESFKAAVSGRTGTKAENLNLLRSLLDGEPRELIAGLKLDDANYDVALRLMKEAYGAKEQTRENCTWSSSS